MLVLGALATAALLPAVAVAQVAGSIAVYPGTSSLEFNSTVQFVAYVPISPNTVTWLVNDVPGGNTGVGTISATGFYTPPTVIPVANVVVIKARSTAFPSSFGTASLTVTRPYPWLWSASPSTIPVGNFHLTFNGSNFAADSQVLANGAVVTTTFVSSTSLIVSGVGAQTGIIQFAVRQPGPGAVTGNNVTVTVTAAPVGVVVTPATALVQVGNAQSFSAAVTGTVNTAVNWSVNGTIGGTAAAGTISASGVYMAPGVVPSPSVVTIRAASVANPASFAQASVTVVAPVTVSVSPVSAMVPSAARGCLSER